MSRTYVVTGSASGMGRATAERLAREGARVLGVDVHSADVVADLGSPEGRAAMVEAVRAATASLDGVIACAGVAFSGASEETASRVSWNAPETAIRVNYFGAVATLEGLRPLLAQSDAPRAVVVASTAVLRGGPEEVVEACLAGEEERALEAVRAYDARTAYGCSKRAIGRWVRRAAPTPEWAGAGIPLNAIAPGRIQTPMGAAMRADPAAAERFPMPLHGPGEPDDAAAVLAWLASPENVLVTGQVIFVDGGFEALTRGDDIW